jgi:hypothetical protein
VVQLTKSQNSIQRLLDIGGPCRLETPLSFSKIHKLYFKPSKTHVGFFIKSRLDVTILTEIIFKGAANFELKFFQIDIMTLTEFLRPLRKLVQL